MKKAGAKDKHDEITPKPKSPAKVALNQLRALLKRRPGDLGLDIDGLVIDYLGRSGKKLEAVFELNPFLYAYLFGENQEIGQRLLRALKDPAVAERCKDKYPMVFKASNSQHPEPHTELLINRPAEALGYPVRAVVWQLSDVHFGKFYKLKETPRELAFFLAQVVRDYPSLAPDVVVICGDISSIAAQGEFDQFREFCKSLSSALWRGACPERLLLVPGNHDVTWESNGTADRLAVFNRNFNSDEFCVSPFGAAERLMGNGRFKVNRYNPYPDTAPPVAVVHDQEKHIKFALLVSGYFSGNVPADVRKSLTSAIGSAEDLMGLLRIDEGEVTHEYLSNVSDALDANQTTTIGVIHHNPVSYGIEMSRNPLAPKLMETLWMKGVPVVLHGHIHLSESRSNKRPAVPGQSYPIPVSTLTSVTTAGGARGLNIHFIGPNEPLLMMDSLVWNISQSMTLRPEDAAWRYRLRVTPNGCEVEHF